MEKPLGDIQPNQSQLPIYFRPLIWGLFQTIYTSGGPPYDRSEWNYNPVNWPKING